MSDIIRYEINTQKWHDGPSSSSTFLSASLYVNRNCSTPEPLVVNRPPPVVVHRWGLQIPHKWWPWRSYSTLRLELRPATGQLYFFSCSSPKLLVGHQCKSTKVASQRRHTWHTSYWALHTLPVPVHCLAWWLTLPIGNWIFGNIFLYKRRMSSMYMIDRINLASQDHETPNHLPWPRCRTLDHWLSDPSLGWETEPSHHNQQRISINSINIAAICQVAVKKNMCFLLNKDWVKLLRSLAKVLET